MSTNTRAHPWMANSAPGAIQAMLDEICLLYTSPSPRD